MSLKEMLTKILQAINPYGPINLNYTTGTANTFSKVGNVTIPKDGLYRFYVPYVNTSVYGVGYSGTSQTSVSAVSIISDNVTSATVIAVAWLPKGEISIWTRCGSAGRNNYLTINPILTI